MPLGNLLSRAPLVVVFALLLTAGCEAPPEAHSEPNREAPEATKAAGEASKADTASKKPQPTPPAPAASPTRPASFADIVAKVRPAVVNIYTRKQVVTRSRISPFTRRGIVPQRRVAESLGSGFIIDKEGHVLTNFHVVDNATEIGVRLLDERFFEAELIGADPKTDVALLRIKKGKDLPVIELGDAHKLRVGDWVVAIGNPLGLASTVTAGIASAIGRKGIPISEEMRYQDFIQTDASINPGNSGGPLINTDGEVVGINTAISAEGQGIGFAIPINMAQDILPQLKKKGRVERSWLGIYIGEIPGAVRRELGLSKGDGGALVTRVVPGGPAEKAKLQRGDIIMAVDGKAIDDAGHLTWLASNLGIGRTVVVDLQRGDKRMKTELTLGALPD
ncbi:trypsin-like serine protease [Persicimonas caeni]|uniref:Trypsin-like serine protease n=1 Tax=Persicimonas caeni TaxID=2292766 RepID=A0A4Y6PZP8_PERCE|nr:trypsin-like peptidase domain-containing protein [Persicimonas caeni]QDG53720.1 trypsin-like serine protease [Persicimonas caeni]QED34941.1 trypsin-like serine protease [Persicimonas caeni]